MTKMTVLHLASPFAISMPATPRHPLGTERGNTQASGELTPLSISDGTLPSVPVDRGSASPLSEDAVAATEGAGFEASLYDTVLSRYREQLAPLANANLTPTEGVPDSGDAVSDRDPGYAALSRAEGG